MELVEAQGGPSADSHDLRVLDIAAVANAWSIRVRSCCCCVGVLDEQSKTTTTTRLRVLRDQEDGSAGFRPRCLWTEVGRRGTMQRILRAHKTSFGSSWARVR